MNRIEICDVLPRKERALDMKPVLSMIRGKRVAITGAGGYIGSELARQIADFQPECLTLIDNCEHNLYQIARQIDGVCTMNVAFGDVRDAIRMVLLLRKQDLVFHAAAMKHVTMCEENPTEANETNVNGTFNVVSSCRCPVVLVSTDKAVNPTSHMGRTKREAEQIVLETGRGAVVRFGNVLGSSGSVFPLFVEQIERGGPVTVTHPDVERWFMTVGEAAELILQAGAHGPGTYILDMGSPVKILNLAQDMIALSGTRYPIQIQITGLKPGERLKELLWYDDEDLVDIGIDGVMMARA